MFGMAAPRQLQRYLEVAVRAARQAGMLLAAHVGEPTTVDTKRSVIDLVTDIDRASEQLIHRVLQRAFPDHGFHGEEHAHLRSEAPYTWIVDPIDGTTNFVHGVPAFAVSIGLVYHHAPLLGVIYDPMRKELFSGLKGRGAFLNGQRLSVSRTRFVEKSLLSTGFSSKFRVNPQPYLRWFRTFQSRSHAVRRIGCTTLSLAYVASGRLDGFYEQDLWPWDIAAGLLIVQEAGGRVSDFHGRPPVLRDGELLATNGRIHQEMLRLLRSGTRARSAARTR